MGLDIAVDREPASPVTSLNDMAGRPAKGGRAIRRPSPDTAARRLLIVASRFPPAAMVGATRTAKFVKYLGRFGWEAHVITGTADALDAATADDVEDACGPSTSLRVHRLSPYMDNWPVRVSRGCGRWVEGMFGRLVGEPGTVAAGLDWRFRRIHDRLAFPDRGIWRLPQAVHFARQLHRQQPFDALFTTAMPFSDHLIGLALQRLLRLPWLADFRDPWVENVHLQQWNSERGRRLTERAERAVVRRAGRVLCVSDAVTDRFRVRYPRVVADKFVTVPNGFDPDDFPRTVDRRPRSTFKLLYAGSLYGARSPRHVLGAFRCFLDAVPGSRTHARFEFAGRRGPHTDELVAACDNRTTAWLGLLSHRDALRAMAAADVNVVMLPNVPGGEHDICAKIYECLGSGRPILAAIPPEGAAARILRNHDGVWICEPDDIMGIAHALTEIYRRWLGGTLRVVRPREALRPLTRESQTQRLAECLDAVAHPRRAKGGRK